MVNKEIVNLDKIKQIYEDKKIDSIQIVDHETQKCVPVNVSNFSDLKTCILDSSKLLNTPNIIVIVNIYQNNMILETRSFIGGA